MSFPAKYAGQCVECGCRIQVDDEIERGTEGGYVHVTCPEDAPTKPTKFQGADLESIGLLNMTPKYMYDAMDTASHEPCG